MKHDNDDARKLPTITIELTPQTYVKHPEKSEYPPVPLPMAPFTWDIEKMRQSLELLEKSICGYERNNGHNQQLEYEYYAKMAKAFVSLLQSTTNLAAKYDIDLATMADSAFMNSVKKNLI